MRQRADRTSAEIPTSAMADIAFLLVVYFMLTITLTATRGLDFGLSPEEPSRRVELVEAILVEVEASGRILVDGQSLRLEKLLEHLRPKLEAAPDKPVILKTSGNARYDAMVEVFDEIRQGKERLGLAREINVAIPTRREQEQFWR